MMPTAKQRAWISKDRVKLVPDGHAEAAVLFARVGQQISDAELKRFENSDEFFANGSNPAAKREVAKNFTAEVIPAKPKAKKNSK